MPQFLFVTCQVGAERAVKDELGRRWPEFRFAFSRPGFLTFKLPEDGYLPPDFDLESVFARAYGFSLGKVAGSDTGSRAEETWRMLGDRPIQRIHVWDRERTEPRERTESEEYVFAPEITSEAVATNAAVHEVHKRMWRMATCAAIRKACPRPERLSPGNDLTEEARPGDWIMDCILVEPDQWWVGYHRARSAPSRWPGGMMPLEMPPDAVSRAWLKMEEALRWSQLPIPKGARCAEIGSAPGGASQALLARGFEVVGIDPAEMDPAVLIHPKFRHIRRRAMEVPRREFRKIRWLTADMNVAPKFTLDAVEAIVTYPEVHVRGLLLTLKLADWSLAEHVPEYLDRIRGWGYNLIRARQLQHNRREFCVAALQKPFQRK